MDPRIVARVLKDLAETASETLELQDVFQRVATSVRELIPIDNMGVVQIVDGDRAVVHATTLPCHAHSDERAVFPGRLVAGCAS